METHISDITSPQKLLSRDEVFVRNCPVPKAPGVYGWYFREIPPGVPTDHCITHQDLSLLYVGISPKKPPKNGSQPSSENLRTRIRYHYTGNAEGSTLRLTLGCLLRENLRIQLRRVGSGKRMTFSSGERTLSQWMGKNAFVVWTVHPEPWELESELLGKFSLPLNLQGNKSHPFHPELTRIRSECRERARELPVLER